MTAILYLRGGDDELETPPYFFFFPMLVEQLKMQLRRG